MSPAWVGIIGACLLCLTLQGCGAGYGDAFAFACVDERDPALCNDIDGCYWGEPTECCVFNVDGYECNESEFQGLVTENDMGGFYCAAHLNIMVQSNFSENSSSMAGLHECCGSEAGCAEDDGYGINRRRVHMSGGRAGFSYVAAAAAVSASRASAAARGASKSGSTGGSGGSSSGGGGSSGGGSSCFVAGTLLQLESGEWRRIEDIRLGDHVAMGGRVTGRMEFEVAQDELFMYRAPGSTSETSIIVAQHHAVLEQGIWRRVKDSTGSAAVDDELWQSLLIPGESFVRVYDLDVVKHRLLVASGDETIVFSDFSEIDADSSLNQGLEDALLSHLQKQHEEIDL